MTDSNSEIQQQTQEEASIYFRFYVTKCGGILQVHCFEEKHKPEIDEWAKRNPELFNFWITEWASVPLSRDPDDYDVEDCMKMGPNANRPMMIPQQNNSE